MASRDLICPMCYYQAPTRKRLICHCLVQHKNESQFIALCTVPGCMYSTQSYNAFKIHNRRKHGISATAEPDLPTCSTWQRQYDDNEQELIVDINVNENVQLGYEDLHSRSYIMMLAKFYLSLEADHKCSRNSLNTIALFSKDIISSIMDISSTKVKSMLESLGQNEDEIKELLLDFNKHLQENVLLTADKFLTTYSRDKVYSKLCHLVKPRSCHMGYENVRIMGRRRRNFLYGYYIPMKEMLQALLNLPEIWEFVTHPQHSQDDIQRDVNDGTYIKTHPLNQEPQKFLKISLSFDDVEIQNPLRSSHKYKLSMFYFQILNIPVEYRSKLTSIFLYAVCKTKYIQRFGMKNILRNFTETMNELRTTGIDFQIQNCSNKIKGDLVFVICDTPAAAALGGFKEGCAFAQKPCRRCLANQKTMREKFRPCDFRNRTLESYLDQCTVLESPDLSKGQRSYWSKNYGVNGRSPLCDISGFDVTSQIVMDNMHLLAEGCLGYLLGLFLHYCIIENRYFTLEWLNTQIQNYNFAYWDQGHKPEMITRHQIVSDIYVKQKAVAMISLVFCLPHILGPIFPLQNDHYRHFIHLVQMTQLAFSPYTSPETCAEMEHLMDNIGTKWTLLYPLSRVRPKLHFLIHFSETVKKFGSLHGISCLRFESKHGYFKDARIKQYRNLSYSLASKHQLYLCNKMIDINGAPSKNFIYAGDEIGTGNVISVSRLNVDLYEPFCREFGNQETFEVYETTKCTINGIEYRNGAIILIHTDDLAHPHFGLIEHIFVLNDVKYFAFIRLDCNCYLWQFHSYDCRVTEGLELMKWDKLSNKFPLQLTKIDGKQLVMNRFSQHCGNI